MYVDIGANIGSFLYGVGREGYRSVGIEAMARNAVALWSTWCEGEDKFGYRQNPDQPLVEVLHRGLGSKYTRCVVMSEEGNEGDGHTKCDPSETFPASYKERGTVELVPLDDVFFPKNGVGKENDVFGVARIGLIKIDVEGYEPLVLAGGHRLLLRSGVPYITAEYAPAMMRDRLGADYIPASFIGQFVDAGYRVSAKGFFGDPITRQVWQDEATLGKEHTLAMYDLYFTLHDNAQGANPSL